MLIASRGSATRGFQIPSLILTVLCVFSGCEIPEQKPSAPVTLTQSDQLRLHYDDLATGRFAVVADFEDPAHMELFRLEGAAVDTTVPERRDTGGVAATGPACLRAVLGGNDRHLVADNRHVRGWLLKRNWRPYNLLVMNVHCPTGGLPLEVTLVSGRGKTVREAHSLIPLRSGWNLLRLDLNEAGDFVALDDIRQIRWSLPGGREPIELIFDDLMLADNRREVFGGADADEGRLYVVQDGRGINVGAAGRFELGFLSGQIVRWYALGPDAFSAANRVGPGNALGPVPVVLRAGKSLGEAEQWPGDKAARVVTAEQRVRQANDARVVVECIWRLGYDPVQPGVKDSPSVAWTYTVYPSGQVFVDVNVDTDINGQRLPALAWQTSVAPGSGVQESTSDPLRLADALVPRNQNAGWLAWPGESTGLLFVEHVHRSSARMSPVRDLQATRVSLLVHGAPTEYPQTRWQALLNVWPPGNTRAEIREAVVNTYTRRPEMSFVVGDLDRDTLGDHDRDGFNERFGAFMLQPDRDRVQLRLDGRERPIFYPVFQIRGGAGRESWVYVDHVVQRGVTRLADDDLIFQIERVIDSEMIVEVYLREPAAQAPAP